MEIPSIFIGLVLFGASLIFVSLPFQQKPPKNAQVSKKALAKSQREAILSALRDLDFDFKTGKVSEEDYQPLRSHLMAEAAQYIEMEREEEEQLEELIRSRRSSQQIYKCQYCDAPIQAGQRFCSKCGSAVELALCPSCGKKLYPGDLFCSACGNKIQIQVKVVA